MGVKSFLGFLVFCLYSLSLSSQPLFTTITLEEFGFLTNTNPPLQPINRFNTLQPLRTNDFQVLQQTLAANREVIRMGAFYISQGAEGVGICLPAFQSNGLATLSTPIDNTQLIVGCTQSQNLLRVSNLITSQALTVSYFLPDATVIPQGILPTTPSAQTMVDYNIIGNAFHDVFYNGLTPQLTFNGGATMRRLFVDDVEFLFQFVQTPPGTKFKIELTNGQVWLLYAELSDSPIQFVVGGGLTTLTCSERFIGYLRVAAIEVNPVPTQLDTTPLAQSAWATSIVAQTRPPTPISMYMLWPLQWITRVAPQIRENLGTQFQVPSCNLVPYLLPVLARVDVNRAYDYFVQIPNFEYPEDLNPFLTAFMMYTAFNLSADIAAYQTTPPMPCPAPFAPPPPPYSITPNALATERTFDANRNIIPISADVAFLADRIQWSYSCANAASNPLIIFPSYRILQGTVCPSPPNPAVQLLPIAGFAYRDPIKGLLLGTLATDNQVTFIERLPPTWYQSNFFPPFLKFNSGQALVLQTAYNETLSEFVRSQTLPGAGREVYKLALSGKCGAFFYKTLGFSGANVRGVTQSLFDIVKEELSSWLHTHLRNNLPISDFFTGDIDNGGICASAGMSALSDTQAAVDEGNAIYNNHHLQYGYWLAAAAFVVDWDREYLSPDPWISQQIVSDTGSVIKNKDLVDMLWRDCCNPDKEDPIFPFNRHGNPWEGHGTQNGILYAPLPQGRNEERFAEDFHCWMAVNQYAKAILLAPTLTTQDKQGFATLESFSRTNMEMTASAGKLIYHDNTWLYSGLYGTTITVGNVFDTQSDAAPILSSDAFSCPLFPYP